MFNRLGKSIISHHLINQMIHFKSGIEIERFRINKNGQNSTYKYPDGIGDQSTNPWITNDYLETMSEIISPPTSHYLDSIHYIHTLSEIVRQHLSEGELLWPLSMPPILPKVSDKRLLAKTSNPVKRAYLEYLVDKYGISHGTPCGIHINLSLNQSAIETLSEKLGTHFLTQAQFKNHIYQLIASGFMQYRWFLTYLLGASPVAEENYFAAGDSRPTFPVRSLRQSHYGFITSFPVDYTNINDYVDRIQQGLADGSLANEAEFHGPIRFKGNDLKQNGAQYIELRMIDLDPFADCGIKASTVMLIQLMSLFFIMTESLQDVDGIQQTLTSDEMNERVACESPQQQCTYQLQAKAFWNQLSDFNNTVDLGPEYSELLDGIAKQIHDPELTVNGQLAPHVRQNSLIDFGVQQAQKFQDAAQQSCYRYDFFENNDDDYAIDKMKQAFFKGTWE